MIRLCAFSDEYGDPFQEQIEGLQKNGIKLMEIRNVDGKNIADLDAQTAQEYYEKLTQAGIAVWSIGSPLGKVDVSCDFDAYLDVVRHVCKLANIFHCSRIRMFSFFKAYDDPEKVYKYLREMVKIGEQYGVTMCHENEKEIFGDTVERVLQIRENVPGLGLIYDPANYLQCGQDCRQAMQMLFDSTTYFHIKDVDVKTQALVPAGYGDGAIRELVSRIDRDTVLTVEPHLAVFSGYAAIDNTEMVHKFHFPDNPSAFCAAVNALKDILLECGYVPCEDGFEKKA